LDIGVEVYEFKKDAQVRFKLMIPQVQSGINYKAVYGYHPKTIIIDGNITAVGSYNLDPRSANYNTECIIIARSEEVTKNLHKPFLEEILPGNAWRITKDWNPDKKAGFKKRFKAASRKIIPKKLL
jgi:cardiolipin synthase C